MPSVQETCRCKGYAFPHREGSGQCKANDNGPYCGECGEAAKSVERDFGIGAYECHGHRGVHRDVHTVSDCCEANLYSDASLTIAYTE